MTYVILDTLFTMFARYLSQIVNTEYIRCFQIASACRPVTHARTIDHALALAVGPLITMCFEVKVQHTAVRKQSKRRMLRGRLPREINKACRYRTLQSVPICYAIYSTQDALNACNR